METSVNNAIDLHISEHDSFHEEMDWWYIDNVYAINIHNCTSESVYKFNVDVYNYIEGEDVIDYTKWKTVKRFNMMDYKAGLQ